MQQSEDRSKISSPFLIDVPTLMLLIQFTAHLSILRHQKAIVTASSSFLIDMPTSMLPMTAAIHLFMLHR